MELYVSQSLLTRARLLTVGLLVLSILLIGGLAGEGGAVAAPRTGDTRVRPPTTPAAAVTGFFKSAVEGDLALACHYVIPDNYSQCTSDISQVKREHVTWKATVHVDGVVTDGEGHALVSVTGRLCGSVPRKGTHCLPNRNRSTGMPSASLDFIDAYEEATAENANTPLSPIACQQVGPYWYIASPVT